MRGKENMRQMCEVLGRITPAYAGKSLSQAEIPAWE